jgi:segregation and condensation protein B
MSSRKRKKKSSDSVPASNGHGPSSEPEAAADSAEAAEPHDPSDTIDTNGEAFEQVGAETTESDEASSDERSAADDGPAVSEISELRPRDSAFTEDESVELASEASAEAAAAAGAEASEAPTTRAHLKRLIESLIFVSDQIISPLQIARIVKAKQVEVRELVTELSAEYEGRGIELVEVAGGYQFRSAAASAPFVRDLVAQRPVRLTRAQLETLALIAYRQPITRPEIDDVRGVDSGSAIKVLLERDLVKILGRKDEAGRPLLYGTAPYFLEFFSMKGMQDLPTLREFTELNDEHRELFQRKTGEIPDLSAEMGSLAPSEYVDPEDESPVTNEVDSATESEAQSSTDETMRGRGEGQEDSDEVADDSGVDASRAAALDDSEEPISRSRADALDDAEP